MGIHRSGGSSAPWAWCELLLANSYVVYHKVSTQILLGKSDLSLSNAVPYSCDLSCGYPNNVSITHTHTHTSCFSLNLQGPVGATPLLQPQPQELMNS